MTSKTGTPSPSNKKWNAGRILLVCLLAFSFIHILSSFLLGVSPAWFALFPVGALAMLAAWGSCAISIIYSLSLAVRRERFMKLLVPALLLIYPLSKPGIYYSRAGALWAANRAGTAQIVTEARKLIEDCRKANLPSGEVRHIEAFPPALKALRPCWIWASRDRVLIKKFGLGDFAGFVIVPSGASCSGTQLSEGLYWQDAGEPGGAPRR